MKRLGRSGSRATRRVLCWPVRRNVGGTGHGCRHRSSWEPATGIRCGPLCAGSAPRRCGSTTRDNRSRLDGRVEVPALGACQQPVGRIALGGARRSVVKERRSALIDLAVQRRQFGDSRFPHPATFKLGSLVNRAVLERSHAEEPRVARVAHRLRNTRLPHRRPRAPIVGEDTHFGGAKLDVLPRERNLRNRWNRSPRKRRRRAAQRRAGGNAVHHFRAVETDGADPRLDHEIRVIRFVLQTQVGRHHLLSQRTDDVLGVDEPQALLVRGKQRIPRVHQVLRFKKHLLAGQVPEVDLRHRAIDRVRHQQLLARRAALG